MVLTVHHLQVSQSERIVWLCEELGIPYELKLYQRAPVYSPKEYLELHPLGAAPVITDGDVKIAESEACMEYIINIHGNGKLTVKPGEQGYADYLYWYHFANGTLQPGFSAAMRVAGTGVPEEHPARALAKERNGRYLSFLDKRVKETGAWLAGKELTAADIMIVFSLTTMRKFNQWDLSSYPNVIEYLHRVAARDVYQSAMRKGDADLDIKDAINGPPPDLFGPIKARQQQAKLQAKH